MPGLKRDSRVSVSRLLPCHIYPKLRARLLLFIFWGAALKKHCKTRDFGHSAPAFGGVHLPPPKFRGYGLTGNLMFSSMPSAMEKVPL